MNGSKVKLEPAMRYPYGAVLGQQVAHDQLVRQ